MRRPYKEPYLCNVRRFARNARYPYGIGPT
jgi:hypothetical protein